MEESTRTAELCAILGHELRNPLAAVTTNLAVAMEMTDELDPRASFLQRAATDLERLSGLLTAYLDYGRGARLELDDCAIDRLVRRVADRNGAVSAHPEADVEIRVDANLVERAIENLAENALAAGAHRVEVHTAIREDSVSIDVSDDGPGVPAELGTRCFEPFVSGRGSSGMGLAVTRDVVRAHGGEVELVANDAGATFRISLPLPKDEG